ncbi:class I SAM-dependent methyltransferase [Pelagibacteraceae bacterium]|nr:class I SAM-dependent methyltransferase [Pelagibacteraceae bacterium]
MKKKIIGTPTLINDRLIEIVKNTKINNHYIKNKGDFRDHIIKNILKEDEVLDIGKAMREKFDSISCKNLETLDVNDYGDYPDIIFDLCSDNIDFLENKYDKIICIAILEHVYNPFKAVNNLYKMIKPNGVIFGYAPYLYHYHAPKDLQFQDYFRFSKDALSYLFKDFKEVELFPVRGRVSTPFNLLFAGKWKKYIEKTGINILLDKISSNEKNSEQCSGFYFVLKK